MFSQARKRTQYNSRGSFSYLVNGANRMSLKEKDYFIILKTFSVTIRN